MTGAMGKKKYAAGEGAQFMTRKSALKKLQLTLKEFSTLCIIKGIYPREPRNRKRAQKGKAGIKTLYHVKDIQFLLHEPLVWHLRDKKVYNKKITKARNLRDGPKMKRLLENQFKLKLDHVVKERYPTFIDALRELDDCLTLCFLFATFPSMKHIPRDQSPLCRRLTVEFMNAVIAANALRKVFISIKGYYYQAEIKGQMINWIVPHKFSHEPQAKADVDFRVMSTFVEFYITMLGFTNFAIYQALNLYYPPKFNSVRNEEKALVDEEDYLSERISAMNVPLLHRDPTTQQAEEEEVKLDEFEEHIDESTVEEGRVEAEKIRKLKSLFKGKKFFLNREVPRDPLVFVIRCFGGEVSWDKFSFVGSTFDEDDETINYQIVDRPSMEKQYLSRYYVQPQWIFDSVNARELLPVEKYFMGAILPPHLSPFNTQFNEVYMPPEERALVDPTYKLKDTNAQDDEESEIDDEDIIEDSSGEEEDEQDDNPDEDDDNDEEMEEDEDLPKNLEKKEKEQRDKVQEKMTKIKTMKVQSGEVTKEDPWAKEKQAKQDYRLREKMIAKKHRKLYKSMMKGREDRKKDIWLLCKKRRLHESAAKN